MRQEMESDSDSIVTFYDGDAIPSSPTTESKSPPHTASKLRHTITKARKSLEEIKVLLSTKSLTLKRYLNWIFDGSLI
jgi:hypothetical protein